MIAIKKFRSDLGWTQEKLAHECAVAKSTVAMWEAGERKPDIVMLKKLSQIFNCTADELLAPITVE